MKELKKLQQLLVAILILAVAACQEGPKEGGEAMEQKPVPRPEQIIDLTEAQNYYDRYGKRRSMLIQQFEDSVIMAEESKDTFNVGRYVSYDLQTLKDYIAYIEQQADSVDAEIKTLRLYFGNYPNDPKRVHPRQNTIFFVPAVALGNREYGLFIDGDKPGYLNGRLRVHKPGGEGSKAQAGFFSSSTSLSAPLYQNGSLIMNVGSTSPPPNY